MSRQREREEFIAKITAEGVPVNDARKLMRHATALQRIAELQCSSEAADRDRVKCLGDRKGFPGSCLCRDYGAYTDPSSVSYAPDRMGHGTIPRINAQAERLQARVEAVCAPYGVQPVFQGDPRGAVLKLQVPSGKTDDWGQVGICVP